MLEIQFFSREQGIIHKINTLHIYKKIVIVNN